ncbi:MAG: phosphotransferase [Pseudomonadales bacterium]|nr:phosphotransferase [Pseudomonadales bacterium]MBO7004989.1 phosphotransferase [Pseudomonadales bacterium]
MTMIVQEDVPFSVDELTADWLSRALKVAGVLEDGTVEVIELQRIGAQVGFNGEVVIVLPSYANLSEVESPPASLVLKIPTATKNRILGQTMGLYEKEIRFYRDLQPVLNIRTPKHYCSALDEADDPDVILERLYGMNRLPLWIIRGIMALASWFVSGHPRKYALFIEDLSGYRLGDQAEGCSPEDIRNIVSTMGRLHGQYWGSEELAGMSWIAPYSVTSRIMQMRYLSSVQRYLKHEGVSLSDKQRDMLAWLKSEGINLTERFDEGPATLLHGDVRLDNMGFDDDTNEVVLFDWQTLLRGPGAADLSYFISATLPVEASEAEVNELIDLYHQSLVEQGVALDRPELRKQYEVGMLLMFHRILPAIYEGDMELGDDRGLPLLQAWIARILARLESVDHRAIAT